METFHKPTKGFTLLKQKRLLFFSSLLLATSLNASAVQNDIPVGSHPGDSILRIKSQSVTQQSDGQLTICYDSKSRAYESCSTSKKRLGLNQFLQVYFPAALNLRVSSMDIRENGSMYYIWITRGG